ncbi:Aste57867_14548 [Aphanomyces stellatus]|uniref:Aste57867_14548 protein n=1 Tax=Aphanomyces stellatus TaxID=120398 RepID=A0A485L2M0_9STRA|nr:hypothetical protein As57867_014494 [Aphanomyces stellatus]VFT91369.1 Aste57867_14548 [Aphanomyces stellatus]
MLIPRLGATPMRHLRRASYVETSVALPNTCPDLRESLGFIRAHIHRSGLVLSETDRPGYLELTQIYHIDMGGLLPKWILNLVMKIKSLRHMDRYVREKRLSTTAFRTAAKLVHAHAVPHRKRIGGVPSYAKCRKASWTNSLGRQTDSYAPSCDEDDDDEDSGAAPDPLDSSRALEGSARR